MKQTVTGKKGTLGGPMVDFYAYIAFVFIIILFLALFSINAQIRKGMIKGSVENIDINTGMQGYLRAPVAFEEKQTTMEDLIISLEEDIIEMEKDGKQYACTDLYMSETTHLENNNKCDLLISMTKSMFKQGTWIRAGHFSDKDIESVKETKLLGYTTSTKLTNLFVKSEIAINKAKIGKCFEQKLQLYDNEIHSPRHIRFWICRQET